jgi:hypothetical protein
MLSNDKVVGNDKDPIAPEIQRLLDSPEGKSLLTDTLQIWLDVIEDSKRKQQSGAAGLCGPMDTSSTMNMTGMADKDVKQVSSTPVNTDEKLTIDQVDPTTTADEEENFEERLLDVSITSIQTQI